MRQSPQNASPTKTLNVTLKPLHTSCRVLVSLRACVAHTARVAAGSGAGPCLCMQTPIDPHPRGARRTSFYMPPEASSLLSLSSPSASGVAHGSALYGLEDADVSGLRSALVQARAEVAQLTASLSKSREDAERAVAVARAEGARQAALDAARIAELEGRLAVAAAAALSPAGSGAGGPPRLRAKGRTWEAAAAGESAVLRDLLRREGGVGALAGLQEADEVRGGGMRGGQGRAPSHPPFFHPPSGDGRAVTGACMWRRRAATSRPCGSSWRQAPTRSRRPG